MVDEMGHSGVLWQDGKGKRMAKRYVLQDFTCKFCGSGNLVMYGKYHGRQRWFCKDCQRKFAQNDALPKMKSPVTHVGAAIQHYYDGLSFNEISRSLETQLGYKVANSTIYRWVDRFTRRAVRETRDIRPAVGDTWICDETMLTVGGKKYWFWDCIDSDTRYLLSSRMVTSRGTAEARALVEAAADRAGKTPKVIVTDQLGSYINAVDMAFGSDAKHVQGGPFNVEANTNLIERFHGSLKDRTKVLRGLKKPETARLFLQGWLIHYNLYSPHFGLAGGQTPAHAAGIRYPHRNWLDFVKSPEEPQSGEPEPSLTLHHPPEPPNKSAAATLGRGFAGQKVKVRTKPAAPVIRRKYARQGHRAPKVVDLGGDIVRDRRGRHLRL